MRAHSTAPTLFVAFARGDLALARPAAEQLRGGAAALQLDYSLRSEPFDTEAAGYIRASLRLRIARCAATLCLLGDETVDDPWVRWTLGTAQTLRRPLFGAPLRGAPPPAAAGLLASLGGEIVPLRGEAIRARLQGGRRLVTPAPPQASSLSLTLELLKRHLR